MWEGHTGLKLREKPDAASSAAAPSASDAPPAPNKPSIAVLPFTYFGGNPEQDYLADGITEDIITALARLRWLFVIARNSSFVYKGRAVDMRQVSRELGVRYALEGSVRTVGDVTEQVVAAVEPHLYAEEGFRAGGKQPDSIDAWGLVVRALSLTSKIDRSRNEEARKLLARAIEMDAGYARAHALLSWALWWAAYCYWLPDRSAGYAQAAAQAEEAVSLDANDPWARMTCGLSLSQAAQHERALAELRASLQLNPSFALGRMVFGWALCRAGDFDAAVSETARALRMSPVDSFSGFYTSIHGLALISAHRFEEALPHLRASVVAFANFPGHYNTLISCCGHLGLLKEAQDFIAIRERMGPPLRLSVLGMHINDKFANKDLLLEGLRKAGVPE